MNCLKTERFVHHKTGQEKSLRLKNSEKKDGESSKSTRNLCSKYI